MREPVPSPVGECLDPARLSLQGRSTGRHATKLYVGHRVMSNAWLYTPEALAGAGAFASLLVAITMRQVFFWGRVC